MLGCLSSAFAASSISCLKLSSGWCLNLLRSFEMPSSLKRLRARLVADLLSGSGLPPVAELPGWPFTAVPREKRKGKIAKVEPLPSTVGTSRGSGIVGGDRREEGTDGAGREEEKGTTSR